MSLAWRRIKVYSRVAIVVFVVGAIGLVLFKNRDNKAKAWFFGLTDATKEVNVIWVMLGTAAFTRSAWWVFSFARAMLRDFRELKRERALTEVAKQNSQRAAELAERERRLDEKLKQTGADLDKGAGEQKTAADGGVEGEV